ncbi:hypothetical protein M758_UG217800 [Ceratodon purpureus]|nr:hypothetical protein M758_UG217800 [Ceratodon purpureus]
MFWCSLDSTPRTLSMTSNISPVETIDKNCKGTDSGSSSPAFSNSGLTPSSVISAPSTFIQNLEGLMVVKRTVEGSLCSCSSPPPPDGKLCCKPSFACEGKVNIEYLRACHPLQDRSHSN